MRWLPREGVSRHELWVLEEAFTQGSCPRLHHAQHKQGKRRCHHDTARRAADPPWPAVEASRARVGCGQGAQASAGGHKAETADDLTLSSQSTVLHDARGAGLAQLKKFHLHRSSTSASGWEGLCWLLSVISAAPSFVVRPHAHTRSFQQNTRKISARTTPPPFAA